MFGNVVSLGLAVSLVVPQLAWSQSLPTRYDGRVVVSVVPRDAADVAFLDQISSDRWSCGGPGPGGTVDYLLDASQLPLLNKRGLRYDIAIPDVQALIDDEQAQINDPFRPRGFFDSFPTYAATSSYVDSLVAGYPAFVTRVSVGYSLQNREIFAFRVTSPVPPAAGSPRKPVVIIQSLQHAREWIGLTSTLYTATQLLATYPTDSTVRDMLDRYELLFIPIVNPDGYEITWTSNRYWRKNARTISPPVQVVGVDLNRNWSVGWGLNSGSSGAYNNDTYRGKSAFSEPESLAVRNHILGIPRVAAFVDVHTYAAMILRPWSYQYATPPGLPGLARIGQAMSANIKSGTGRNYPSGGPEILYLASGTAPDWAYGTTGAPAFTIEMYSPYGGFSPGPDTIPASGRECQLAIMAMVRNLCPGDFNLDNAVDDADFTTFVVAYEALASNRGDLTGDGLTDDSDFSLFVAAYDKLSCP